MNDNHEREPVPGEPTGTTRSPAQRAADERIFQEQRDLERIIQPVLAGGVWISAALMLTGLVMNMIVNRALPASAPALNQILPLLRSLQPDGFLGLGLIFLIATPILRVIISAVAFLVEKDWRYAGITTVVLLIVLASILFG